MSHVTSWKKTLGVAREARWNQIWGASVGELAGHPMSLGQFISNSLLLHTASDIAALPPCHTSRMLLSPATSTQPPPHRPLSTVSVLSNIPSTLLSEMARFLPRAKPSIPWWNGRPSHIKLRGICTIPASCPVVVLRDGCNWKTSRNGQLWQKYGVADMPAV